MAIEYPDIMGDYIDARQRFDAGGLHYICFLEPASLPPGGRTELLFLVQSVMDVPLEAALRVELPVRTGRLGRAVNFKTAQPELRVNVAPGEVGLMHVPLTCAADTPNKRYDIKVTFEAASSSSGQTIRPPSQRGRFGKSLIRNPVGLKIASTIGVGYVAKPKTQQILHVEVAGEPTEAELDLAPDFESLWTIEDLERQNSAQHEVSERRIHILPQLSPDALFATLWHESRPLFEAASVPLRMGEAIFLARILTYTATTFLNKGDWYDALLVPMWEAAMRNDLPTTDALWVVTRVGYDRLLRLSVAMSFGLADRAMGREVWSNEEQQAVIDLLSSAVGQGQGELPPEFLYLPLMLGSLAVAKELQMPGEDLQHSLQLLIQARRDRAAIFDDEELTLVNNLFEQLVIEVKR